MAASVKFGVAHIKRAYPLHIITMIIAVWIRIRQFGISLWTVNVLKRDIVLNIFLVQSWYPAVNVNVSLNGVAWYLSSIFFCYLIFIPIHRLLLHGYHSTLQMAALFILVYQILISVIAVYIYPEENIYRWITYDAPFFRIGDFSIGCIWYRLFGRNLIRGRSLEKTYSVIEFLLLGVTIIIVYWDQYCTHKTLLSKVFNNWTTVYIPIACLWILLFVMNRGVITRVFSNPINIWMGKNSLYLFLIHSIVIYWLKVNIPDYFAEINIYGMAIITILTLGITYIYRKLESILSVCILKFLS